MSTAGSTVPATVVGAEGSAVTRAVGILSAYRRCPPAAGLRLLTELAARPGRSVPEEADRLISRDPRLDAVLGRLSTADLDGPDLIPGRTRDR